MYCKYSDCSCAICYVKADVNFSETIGAYSQYKEKT